LKHKRKKKRLKIESFLIPFTNHLKSLPPSLVSPKLQNSKPKVRKKLTQKF